MSLSDAFWFALGFTLLCGIGIGERIIQVDFSSLLPKNFKKAKLQRLLSPRKSPLWEMKIQKDMKTAFEKVLIPLDKADKKQLPTRMDQTFRRKMERQITLLNQQGLGRDIRLTDVVPVPENKFVQWNDDGREWREAVLQCSALERLISKQDGRSVYELYRKNGYVRILQSRHIRNADRKKKKKSYYSEQTKVICPSCGAEVELTSQRTICPYCDGVIQSEFYDWQTEGFEIYEKIGTNLRRALELVGFSVLMFLCVFLCLYLIPDTEISLTAGVGVTILVLILIGAVSSSQKRRNEKLAEQIVRYSENYLRSCINEALYQDVKDTTLLDYGVGTIFLKNVVNTEDTTEITAQVYISEIHLPKGQKPHTKNFKRTLTLQRARYPERRKGDGKFFIEKDCPSCGANFIPDENNCCSFCGYSLQANNAQWVLKKK